MDVYYFLAFASLLFVLGKIVGATRNENNFSYCITVFKPLLVVSVLGSFAKLNFLVREVLIVNFSLDQATNWKLEEAIQLFYIGNEGGAALSSSPPSQLESDVPLHDPILRHVEKQFHLCHVILVSFIFSALAFLLFCFARDELQ